MISHSKAAFFLIGEVHSRLKLIFEHLVERFSL